MVFGVFSGVLHRFVVKASDRKFVRGVVAGSAALSLGVLSLLTPVAAGSAAVAAPTVASAVRPITQGDFARIADGEILYAGDLADTSLAGQPVLDINGDADGDGVPNGQEIASIYYQNGKEYYIYFSHPLLFDTDGDGLSDGVDAAPLTWNVSARDALLMQEISYRDEPRVAELLNHTVKPDFANRNEYEMAWNELAPYWRTTKFWDKGSGLQAYLFTYGTDKLPFLPDGATNFVAFRGSSTAGDFADDARYMGFGAWIDQMDDAISIADEVTDQQVKNVYVAGHSLGGLLTQTFMVHGAASNELGTQLGAVPGDKNLRGNANIKEGFLFNGVALKSSISPWRKQYGTIAAYQVQQGFVHAYQMAQDGLVTGGARVDGALILDAPGTGHSSTSFFKDNFNSVPGFTVGRRDSLGGTGYRDPMLDKIDFVKPTTVKVVNSVDGSKLLEKKVFKPEGELGSVDVAAMLPEHYSLANSVTLAYGTVNTVVAVPEAHEVTYNFVDKTDPASPLTFNEKVTAFYGQSYDLPDLPAGTADYGYRVKDSDSFKVVPGSEITQELTFEVELERVYNPLDTVLTFETADGVSLGSVTVTDSTENRGEERALEEGKLPTGYRLQTPSDNKFKVGVNRSFVVAPIDYTVTYSFTVGGAQVASHPVTAAYGSAVEWDASYLPAKYELAGDAPAPVTVSGDETVAVPVQVREFAVTYRFIHEDEQKGTDSVTVRYGADDTHELVLPAGYRLKNPASDPRVKNVTGEQIIDVAVVPDTFTVTYEMRDEKDALVGTYSETVDRGADAAGALQLPTGYQLAEGETITAPQNVQGDQTVTVRVTKNFYVVTYKFVMTPGDTKGVAVLDQYVEHGEFARPLPGSPPGYEVIGDIASYTPQDPITGDLEIEVPVKRRILKVNYAFVSNGQQVYFASEDVPYCEDAKGVDFPANYELQTGTTYELPECVTHDKNVTIYVQPIQRDNAWAAGGEPTIVSWQQGHTPSTPSATPQEGSAEDVLFEYKTKDAPDSEYTKKQSTEPGNYVLRATVPASTFVKELQETVEFVIYPAEKAVLDRQEGYSGDAVRVTVTNLLGSAPVSFELQSDPIPLGTVTPDAGVAVLDFTIPEAATVGEHHVVVMREGEVIARLPLTVLARAVEDSEPEPEPEPQPQPETPSTPGTPAVEQPAVEQPEAGQSAKSQPVTKQPAGETLAETGASAHTARVAGVAALVVLLGGAVLLVGRRRRTE